METIENAPMVGKCDSCERLTVRLLNAPLVRIPAREVKPSGIRYDLVWFEDSRVVPASLYEVIEDDGDWLICLAPEASRNGHYCWKCFDGHLWPNLRDYVLNLPREIVYNPAHPWWSPKWISAGRERTRN